MKFTGYQFIHINKLKYLVFNNKKLSEQKSSRKIQTTRRRGKIQFIKNDLAAKVTKLPGNIKAVITTVVLIFKKLSK